MASKNRYKQDKVEALVASSELGLKPTRYMRLKRRCALSNPFTIERVGYFNWPSSLIALALCWFASAASPPAA